MENPEIEASKSREPNARGQIIQEDEIDLLELARTIWSRRWFIAKVTGSFALIGILIAFTSKVEYKSSCRLMPESQEGMKGDLGGLGGLAGLAGINLDMGGSGSLTPNLYPEIVKSSSFQLDLINTPIRFENRDTVVSSKNYFQTLDKRSFISYLAEYTIGLPGKILGLFSKIPSTVEIPISEPYIRLSKEEFVLLDGFRSRVNLSLESKTGIIAISAEMPDPVAAAEVTQMVVEKLTAAVTAYKVEKAEDHLLFIESRYVESQIQYERKQALVAQFADENKNLSSSIAQIEYQRLQNDMSIAFEVYKGLASQREQAKIKIKEETPVFTILEPVQVPNTKNKPKRKLIVLGAIVVGFFASLGFVIIKTISLNHVRK